MVLASKREGKADNKIKCFIWGRYLGYGWLALPPF